MSVGYLGPQGSYSKIAADIFRPQDTKTAYPSFFALFAALDKGDCDYIAVPIENTVNGGVLQNIDLLQSYGDISAVEECIVKIDHRLAYMQGADLKGITTIYSHPQALAQCAEYLAANFPGARLVASQSTAASLGLIKSPSEGGIVGAHTKAQGFVLSKTNIADNKENFTHFLLVKRGGPDKGAHTRKVFFSATCKHRPGELLNLLEAIKERGVNMTKIESRPIKQKPGEYRFFIEIEGDIQSQNTIQVLNSVEEKSASFKLLGAY